MQKFIFFAVFSFCTLAFAQEDKQKEVKFYLNTGSSQRMFEGMLDGDTVLNQDMSKSFGRFSVAYTRKKNNLHYTEWELSDVTYVTSDVSTRILDNAGNPLLIQGAKQVRTGIGARLEPYFNLSTVFNLPQKFISYYFGQGVQTWLSSTHLRPYTSNTFRSDEYSLTYQLQFIPRIQLGGQGRLFLDINAPISIIDGKFSHIRRDNPSVPTSARNNWEGDAGLRLQFQARIGLGLRL